MKLSMMLNYAGGFHAAVDRVVELEKAGLDVVWIAEAINTSIKFLTDLVSPEIS